MAVLSAGRPSWTSTAVIRCADAYSATTAMASSWRRLPNAGPKLSSVRDASAATQLASAISRTRSGETNDDLAALIGAAEEFSGPGFLVPLRNTELLRWCLQHDLR